MAQYSDLAYQSTPSPGLLWAFAGSNGATIRVAPTDLRAALAERDWVWIHLDMLDQRARGWAQELCALPDEVGALLVGQDVGLTFEAEDGEIHGVCTDFNLEFLRLSDSVGQFGFVVRDRLLVTGWRHPLAGIDATRRSALAGARYMSGFAVLAAIVAAFCRAAVVRLRDAEGDLDRVEDRLLAAAPSDERLPLKEVRRLALALHRPVTAMMHRLREAVEDEEEDEEEHEPSDEPARIPLPPAGVAAIEDMAARLEALDQAVRATSDRAKLLQEEIAAELADQSNRSLSVLTVMTALMLPGTLVAGVFGMNTGGLPFEHPPWGTLGALITGVIATVIFYRLMARAGVTLKF